MDIIADLFIEARNRENFAKKKAFRDEGFNAWVDNNKVPGAVTKVSKSGEKTAKKSILAHGINFDGYPQLGKTKYMQGHEPAYGGTSLDLKKGRVVPEERAAYLQSHKGLRKSFTAKNTNLGIKSLSKTEGLLKKPSLLSRTKSVISPVLNIVKGLR